MVLVLRQNERENLIISLLKNDDDVVEFLTKERTCVVNHNNINPVLVVAVRSKYSPNLICGGRRWI